MAVELVTSARKYLGTSADTKPTATAATSTLQPGATFFETDTLRAFVWNGTEWKMTSDGQAAAMSEEDTQTELLQTILCELQILRETQEAILAWLES